MTNQELNKAVAEIIKQPGERWSERVCNWAEDLPACMRDLWPWLRETCTIAEVNTAGTVTVELPYQGLIDIDEGDEAHSLCHAVLAVAEKMKERCDVSSIT